MSRKARLEYEGAKYHVFSRGNYRAPMFQGPGARKAFMECLMQACDRAGWVLHSYALMTNHFHLGVETPRGNLVEGMKWLQATFANRFNRYRSENGHVFQGRYHANVLEDEAAMASVAHYIHLNPLEAGIVPIEELASYRESSLWALLQEAVAAQMKQVSCAKNTWLAQRLHMGAPAGLSRYVSEFTHLA